MNKIGFITTERLPVPPVLGGAVENLVDLLILENENRNLYKIIVYSIYNKLAIQRTSQYRNTKFIHLKNFSLPFSIQRFTNKFSQIFSVKIITNKDLFLKKVGKLIKREDINFLIIENRPEFVIPISKIYNGKIVLHLHNDYSLFQNLEINKIYSICWKIIFVSEFLKRRFIDRQKDLFGKYFVLHNCINEKLFTKNNNSVFLNELKKELKISDNDKVIIFCGRLDSSKGIKELLLAVKKINLSNIKLLIVGSSWYGKNNKNNFLKELKNITEEIKDTVLFTGYINNWDLPNYYSISDLVVIPSIWDEPAGLVALEAMAIGVPIISSYSGGIPEYINEGSALIVRKNNDFITNLANSIQYLLNDKTLQMELVISGEKQITKFSREKYFNEFLKIVPPKN